MSKISEEVINSLSINLREMIKSISRDNVNIEEIRLRSLKPLIVNSNNKDYFYNTRLNKLDLNMDNPYIVSKDDIEQTFQIMCKYSIHSFIDDIKKGFITLRGGHRVGIVGKTIIEDGQVKIIKHISSLNIRISREVLGCSDKVLKHIIKGKDKINNTLIISPPQCGAKSNNGEVPAGILPCIPACANQCQNVLHKNQRRAGKYYAGNHAHPHAERAELFRVLLPSCTDCPRDGRRAADTKYRND